MDLAMFRKTLVEFLVESLGFRIWSSGVSAWGHLSTKILAGACDSHESSTQNGAPATSMQHVTPRVPDASCETNGRWGTELDHML